MQIEEYRDRRPDRLSGGQQQRVALARALVIQPDVLLMDEPLSNLDAKLRVEMRRIKEIQNRIGITTVYVTHDQEEAMAVSDRIAVMNGGVIQQVGAPRALYQRPRNILWPPSSAEPIYWTPSCTRRAGATAWRSAAATPWRRRTSARARRGSRSRCRCGRKNLCCTRTPAELAHCVDDSVFLGLNTHYFAHLESGEKVEIVEESEIGR